MNRLQESGGTRCAKCKREMSKGEGHFRFDELDYCPECWDKIRLYPRTRGSSPPQSDEKEEA